MTIRISFYDNTVRVAVEVNGSIESAITELPQREWIGLNGEEVNHFAAGCHLGNSVQDAIRKAEAKLKDKNT